METNLPELHFPPCLIWLRRSCLGEKTPSLPRGETQEVAEPEGQADPAGASLVKLFSRNTVLFPQVTLILSAIPPGRAARGARWDLSQAVPLRTGPKHLFPEWILSISCFCLIPIHPFSCLCKFPSGYFSPGQRHLPFP